MLKPLKLLILLSFPPILFSQTAPPLGIVSSYVLFSSVGAVTNLGLSQVTGDFGTNSGAVSGFGNVNGQMHIADAITTQCAIDLGIAYTNLSGQIPGVTLGLVLGNGQTLLPDVYMVPGAGSLLNTLTLDACGDPNAVFVFQMNGAFSAAAGSSIELINGAKACNVFWRVDGQMSMATNTSFKGTVIAAGAIPCDVGVQLEGRALTVSGAISVSSITAGIPIECSSLLTGPVSPNIGTLKCFALLATNGIVTNTGTTNIVGSIGTNSLSLPFGVFNAAGVTGTIYPVQNIPATTDATADLTTLHAYLNSLPADIALLYPVLFGNSQVLTPHVYVMNAAATLTDTIFLDARGVTDAIFVIRILGALTTNSNPQVVLVGGALAKNVYWQIEGAVTLSGSGNFKGIIVANNSAIVIGGGVVVNGRVLSINGDITTANVNITGANTVGAASSLPTLCVNTALTNITHATSGGTGIGTITGLPPGVTATWAGNTITISGTPTSVGTFNYSIPLTGGCGSVNATGTIIVTSVSLATPENTVSVASSMPTICMNATMITISHTTTGASSIGTCIGLPAGVIAAWSANTITISGRPNVSGTFNYIIPLNGGCGSINATGTITVAPLLPAAVNVLSSAPTICINTLFSYNAHTTSGVAGIGFISGLPPGVTATWSADTITISGTPTLGGTFNYKIQLTGGCGCIYATGTITVSTTQGPTANIATTSVTICHGVLSMLTGNVSATGAWTLTLSNGQTATGSGNGAWSIIVAPTTTTTYAISSIVDTSPCLSNTSGSVTLTLPLQGTNISNDNESASCQVNQNGWVHFYHVSGRLIASVNSNGQNLGNVSVTSYVDVTNQIIPACLFAYSSTVMQRHWVMTPSIQPVTPVLVRLPFTDVELTTLSTVANSNLDSWDDVNTIADIKLSKYSGPLNIDNIFANNCISAGGNEGTTIHNQVATGVTASYSAVTAAQFTDFSIPGFSELWLHGSSTNSPLPIELLSFTGECYNKCIVLEWSTTSEANNDYFSIERSIDGINWQTITDVPGAGNSTELTNYSFIDAARYNDLSYYRLKQTDYDGQSKYSGIIAIQKCVEEIIELAVFPNPTKEELNIYYGGDKDKIISISIFNVLGVMVYYSEFYQSKIVFENKLNGIYFLQVNATSNISIKKFIAVN